MAASVGWIRVWPLPEVQCLLDAGSASDSVGVVILHLAICVYLLGSFRWSL